MGSVPSSQITIKINHIEYFSLNMLKMISHDLNLAAETYNEYYTTFKPEIKKNKHPDKLVYINRFARILEDRGVYTFHSLHRLSPTLINKTRYQYHFLKFLLQEMGLLKHLIYALRHDDLMNHNFHAQTEHMYKIVYNHIYSKLNFKDKKKLQLLKQQVNNNIASLLWILCYSSKYKTLMSPTIRKSMRKYVYFVFYTKDVRVKTQTREFDSRICSQLKHEFNTSIVTINRNDTNNGTEYNLSQKELKSDMYKLLLQITNVWKPLHEIWNSGTDSYEKQSHQKMNSLQHNLTDVIFRSVHAYKNNTCPQYTINGKLNSQQPWLHTFKDSEMYSRCRVLIRRYMDFKFESSSSSSSSVSHSTVRDIVHHIAESKLHGSVHRIIFVVCCRLLEIMDQNITMKRFNTLKACFVKNLPILFSRAELSRNNKRTHSLSKVRPSKKKKINPFT
jgi:hypothetical protein